MTDERAQEIARLEAQIAALQQALAPLSGMPEAQGPLVAQMEERQQRLVQIQTGGVRWGDNTHIDRIGTLIGRDQVQIEQIRQTVYQIVMGDVAPERLEQIRQLISMRPGVQWDIYQAVAAGLGRANIDVAVDAQGVLRVVDEPDAEHPPLDPGPFQELLLTLRQAILSPRDSLSTEEQVAREKRYRALIIEQFRYLRLEGLSTGTRPIILPLEEVYVHLRAVAEVPDDADAFTPEERRLLRLLEEQHADGRIDEAELREAALRLDAIRRERWTRERLERFPIAKALGDPQQRGLVILGDPGSGKSTLLQFLALSFAEGPDAAAERLQVQGDDADRLPVFAPLAAYDDMLNETPGLTIQEFLARYYDRRRAAPGLAPVFNSLIAQGRALILLDGLDEVIDERRRIFVAEQTTHFVQSALASGNRVVVTSRVYGYRAAPLTANLPHITVLDFRREEIASFARQWFRALKRWEGGGTLTPQAELLAQQEERQLLDEIGRNPGVERLAVNPLLLTMLALLRRQVGTLPQRRIKLYDLYISALIESWEENRSRGARLHTSPMRLDLKEAEGALIELALWLQQHRPSGTASAGDLRALLTGFYLWKDQGLRAGVDRILPPQRRQAEERAQEFLRDMRQFSGLLIERGQGAFGFRHLTFQEYFAGRALARMDRADRWALVKENLHSGRWREPLLLCAARLGVTESRDVEATALVEQVLDAKSEYEPLLHRDLFLAADCAADDIGLAQPLLQRIADGLWETLRSRVPAVGRASLERLHALVLLRAGARARLPEVGRQLVEELLWRVGSGSATPLAARGTAGDAAELLARLPLGTDPDLSTVLFRSGNHGSGVLSRVVSMLGHQAGSNVEVRTFLIGCLAECKGDVRSAALVQVGRLAEGYVEVRTGLLGCLTDPDPQIRHAVVEALAGLVGSVAEVRVALFDCLSDEVELVREAAVEALGTLVEHSPEVRGALLHCLDDKALGVRAAALKFLGNLVQSSAEVRLALLNRLSHDTTDMRVAVVRAVARQAESSPEVCAALLDCLTDGDADVRAAAVRAVGRLAEANQAVCAALLERLADSDEDVRAATVEALGGLAESSPWLHMFLFDRTDDRDEAMREAAMNVVGRLAENDVTVRRALIGCLADNDEDVRLVVVRSVGGLATGYPEVCIALIDRLADVNAQVRAATVRALGGLAENNTEVRQALVDRLADDAEDVRLVAVRALGTLADGDAEVREKLLGRLHDYAEVVRAATVEVLVQPAGNRPEVLVALLDQLAHPTDNIQLMLRLYVVEQAKTDVEVRRVFLDRLHHSLPDVRVAIISLLDSLVEHDAEVCEALLGRLTDPHTDVRVAAVRGLSGVIGQNMEVREALLSRLTDPHTDVRVAVVEALGGVAGQYAEVREALLGRLVDPDTDVRVAVVQAVAELSAKNTQLRSTLMSCLGDNERVHHAVIDALRRHELVYAGIYTDFHINMPTGWQTRKSFIVNSKDLFSTQQYRMFMLHLLNNLNCHESDTADVSIISQIAPLAIHNPLVRAKIIDCLSNFQAKVRVAALQALKPVASSNREVVGDIIERLADSDWNVRVAAVESLGDLVEQRADVCAALLDRLSDDDNDVRASAVTALAGLVENAPAIRAAVLERLIDGNEDVRSSAVTALAGLVESIPEVRDALLERLADSDEDVRIAAVRSLEDTMRIHSDMFVSLFKLFQNVDVKSNISALELISKMNFSDFNINNTFLVRFIDVDEIDDKDDNVSLVLSLLAFGEIVEVNREIQDILLDYLSIGEFDKDSSFMSALVLWKSAESNDRVRNTLIRCIKEGDENTRSVAMLGLGALIENDTEVRDVILGCMSDEDKSVRTGASTLLGVIAKIQEDVKKILIANITDINPDVRVSVIEALKGLFESDEDVYVAIVARIADEEVKVRVAVIKLLSRSEKGFLEARLSLIACISDTEQEVRAAAVGALAKLAEGSAEVRTALLDCLASSEDIVRSAAVAALGGLVGNHVEVRAALLERSTNGELLVRIAARAALDALVSEISADWRKGRTRDAGAVASQKSEIRQGAMAALEALLEWSNEAEGVLLDRLANDAAHVPVAVVPILGRKVEHSEVVRKALIDLLNNASVDMRLALLPVLGTLVENDTAVQAALLNCLTDTQVMVRLATVQLLGTLVERNVDVRVALQKLLNDPDIDIQIAVLNVLLPFLFVDPSWIRRLMSIIVWNSPSKSPIFNQLPKRQESLQRLQRRLVEHFASLVHTDQEQRAVMIAQLSSEDWRLRAAAATILGAAGDDVLHEALPHLLAALGDRRGLESWPARIDAAAPLLNDDEYGDEALACVLKALTYDVDVLLSTGNGSGPYPQPTYPDQPPMLRPSARSVPRFPDLPAPQLPPGEVPAYRPRRGLISFSDGMFYPHPSQPFYPPAQPRPSRPRPGRPAPPRRVAPAPVSTPAAVRKQAALTLGKLKALHHRRDVAAQIAALLDSERDPQVLDGLYDALTSLAAAPELEG